MKYGEGNKLISEYMGVRDEGGWINIPSRGWGYHKKGYPASLQYHRKWDWLMPVVQKILSTTDQGLNVYILYVGDALRTADINQVWNAVIDCIESFKPVAQ